MEKKLSVQEWLYIFQISFYNEIQAVFNNCRSFRENGFVQHTSWVDLKPSVNQYSNDDEKLIDELKKHQPIQKSTILQGMFAKLAQQYRLSYELQDELTALFFQKE